MKRIFITALALCLVFGLVTAEAGQKKEKTRKAPPKGSRTEKTEEMKTPRFIDKYPPVEFHAGVLNQASLGGWKVGDFDIWLKKDCIITDDGEEAGYLRDGRRAIVMGSRSGNTLVAWSIRMMDPYKVSERPMVGSSWVERGPNPDVGVLHGKVD